MTDATTATAEDRATEPQSHRATETKPQGRKTDRTEHTTNHSHGNDDDVDNQRNRRP